MFEELLGGPLIGNGHQKQLNTLAGHRLLCFVFLFPAQLHLLKNADYIQTQMGIMRQVDLNCVLQVLYTAAPQSKFLDCVFSFEFFWGVNKGISRNSCQTKETTSGPVFPGHGLYLMTTADPYRSGAVSQGEHANDYDGAGE